MSGLPLGPFKEVQQLVDERFPRLGRKLTSTVGLLFIIAIGLVCLTVIFIIVGKALSLLGFVRWPSIPIASLVSPFDWATIWLLVGWFLFFSMLSYRWSRYQQSVRQREETMIGLLTEIRDKLPVPPPPNGAPVPKEMRSVLAAHK